ncbi:hypothetical protein H072_1598 [Dactylellina haptotyla CBS 200.50]|uniref:A-kinase anchor protein 7-like phosphoesterase domain-containing protein n=1 Tax=Dactylellina haptotyla (strain CBS 200.50) TaxID=1284197 RepID=S8C9S6_DACHA|nr:hypothetical protein H072_1598 [Dactylellina haptotyla CBS 200.50]
MSGEPSTSTSPRQRREPRPPTSRPTHFLCLPLSGKHYNPLPPSYESFKTAIRQFTIDETSREASYSDDDPSIIPPDAFRYFNTLHLTLGVMTLETQEKRERAMSMLESLDLTQFFPTPVENEEDKKLNVTLKGLEAMNPSPKGIEQCTLLIIPPTDAPNSSGVVANQGRLYSFAVALREHFIKAGIVSPENRPLKLHATVVNTVYSRPKQTRAPRGRDGKNHKGRHDRGSKEKTTFNATEVLEKYKDQVWADRLEIDRVEICRMGAARGEEVVGEDGIVEVVGDGYTATATKLIWP